MTKQEFNLINEFIEVLKQDAVISKDRQFELLEKLFLAKNNYVPNTQKAYTKGDVLRIAREVERITKLQERGLSSAVIGNSVENYIKNI